jgi:molybdopterin-guanine dinucleotide biosynthesis protein B
MTPFGIVGASGSGKTTLIAALLPELRRRGLRVSTVKHAHHCFDMDRPGKDSWRHREAGAEEVMVVSNGRWALLHEERGGDDNSLIALIRHMTPVDVVLVEGFKRTEIPRIEVHRPSAGKTALFPEDPGIAAVASDEVLATGGRPLLLLANVPAIADFIIARVTS